MTAKPDWWLVKAADRRVALECGVAALRERLPSFPGVLGAVVFGSYARGEVGPESDLDIIIIRETTLDRAHRDNDIRGSLSLGVPYDLVTLTPAEFDRLSIERSFYEQARREGLWIDATRPS